MARVLIDFERVETRNLRPKFGDAANMHIYFVGHCWQSNGQNRYPQRRPTATDFDGRRADLLISYFDS
jgi:hypothetical protein